MNTSLKTGEKSVDDFDVFGLDPETIEDPYSYYELVRAAGPVYRKPHSGVYMLTGYDDIVDVSRNTDVFSSVAVVSGPFTEFTFPDGASPEEAIAEHRRKMAANRGGQEELLITNDPPAHTEYRALVGKLFTPKRMREVEGYVTQLGNQLIDEFVDAGRVEFVHGFAEAFPVLVIGELLGVPRQDHATLRRIVQEERGEFDAAMGVYPQMVAALAGRFYEWYNERRANPRDDMMTKMATAQLPDGSLPTISDLVSLSIAMYFASQETTARLLTNSAQFLAEHPEIADRLRADAGLVPGFIDEMLRLYPPGAGLFRLAKVDTEVAGVAIPAGSIVWLIGAAGNRDPRQFPDPTTFDLERSNAKAALTFGHGIHFCIGASLARAEGRCGIEALVNRLDDIQLDPAHGKLHWIQHYVLRGVTELHLTFQPCL